MPSRKSPFEQRRPIPYLDVEELSYVVSMASTRTSGDAKGKLLDAALSLIRKQGFAATSVDQLCAAAGVTKGGFFHHFASKEALGVAAAEHWAAVTGPLFEDADYHGSPNALGRLLAYLDLREAMISGKTAPFTCLAGTLAQEVHQSHPKIARAAEAAIERHAQTLEADIKRRARRTWGIRRRCARPRAALSGRAARGASCSPRRKATPRWRARA